MHRLGALVAVILSLTSAAPVKRNAYTLLQTNAPGDIVFELGNSTYLANLQYPKATISTTSLVAAQGAGQQYVASTIIKVDTRVVTQAVLESIIESYVNGDDVFTTDFMGAVYLTSSASGASVDASALSYLESFDIAYLVLDASIAPAVSTSAFSVVHISDTTLASIPAGPYHSSISDGLVALASVYLLYPDTYRDFLFGAYDSNDGNGTHNPLGLFLPKFWDPMIPVPSRIYSWGDDRPMAGDRVAVKDLFDIKGLQTSGGSQAWAYITPTADGTAPSIQRILDLGGVVVGKYKLAQFASGANPWEWQDEHYPFNPRGDGWLTCSASSSGGGCSIAAYDWLDFAIGSDTGSSMRRPAAVSGTFGQRPSQGLISLERVLPLGGATDTAGVFCRDPYKWIKFAKAWYQPDLFQPTSITGLSALSLPDNNAFPRRILYPTDYLPLNNSAAEVILQSFITNMSSIFNMTIDHINFTSTIKSIPDPSGQLNNLTYLSAVPLGVINAWSAWDIIGSVLTTTWARLFDGRFPPIDIARRPGWQKFNTTRYNAQTYAEALTIKNRAVEWYETNFQYSTPDSCSESVMLYDIGTGGFPSYRELNLNGYPNTSFLAAKPRSAEITGANICPIYGCADFTIPIGQVPYYSNVTFHEEMVPVTINMVGKRGCDFMLYNMIEKLADEGVLKAVMTGRTAF